MAENSEKPSISMAPAICRLVAGLLHAGVAIFLWNFFSYDNLWELLLVKPPSGAYILIGMFALGFVPVLYSMTQKSISPVLLVSVLLIVSVYSEWQGYFTSPFGGPGPFGVYILSWIGVVLLAGLAGNIELKLKQRETA